MIVTSVEGDKCKKQCYTRTENGLSRHSTDRAVDWSGVWECGCAELPAVAHTTGLCVCHT